MINAWLDAGHTVSAIVTCAPTAGFRHPLRYLALKRSYRRRLGATPLLNLPKRPDWDDLARNLGATAPDIAVTYGFMRRIPRVVLQVFRHGGVNFHPALLPQYRGPRPFHWLAYDGAWRDFGGVTLHLMTQGFDEGDILAYSRFTAQDWSSRAKRDLALASAMASMLTGAVPEFCAGRIAATPQEPGTYPYARLETPVAMVQPRHGRDDVAALCSCFHQRPGVLVDVDGLPVRLLNEVRSLGAATGEKPVLTRWRIAFDTADHRVLYRRYSSLARRLERLRERWNAGLLPAEPSAFRLGAPPFTCENGS
ncbi:formyltransferase family protein [Terrihabitans rhizophilus]|uniref:Formyltransferase family protein n=1 Tax=Terrihabitans rhizophilus TaxID=3092662 RepID=A0ABU4RQS4_9HYPH|nr:formyltransferase family protein [Terrihabitans sp. PJ23]MDX6806951.1 formyltransferase family protein [Terrihabitans sp. PJ23]